MIAVVVVHECEVTNDAMWHLPQLHDVISSRKTNTTRMLDEKSSTSCLAFDSSIFTTKWRLSKVIGALSTEQFRQADVSLLACK